tara:strand:+ start:150 stop:365 length:216 start_codon:yes stop_codon:yes gene_type:complete
MMRKQYDNFEFDGREYQLKPLPIANRENRPKIRRKNMFEKDHITFELVMFCLGSVAIFSTLVYFLIKMVTS